MYELSVSLAGMVCPMTFKRTLFTAIAQPFPSCPESGWQRSKFAWFQIAGGIWEPVGTVEKPITVGSRTV